MPALPCVLHWKLLWPAGFRLLRLCQVPAWSHLRDHLPGGYVCWLSWHRLRGLLSRVRRWSQSNAVCQLQARAPAWYWVRRFVRHGLFLKCFWYLPNLRSPVPLWMHRGWTIALHQLRLGAAARRHLRHIVSSLVCCQHNVAGLRTVPLTVYSGLLRCARHPVHGVQKRQDCKQLGMCAKLHCRVLLEGERVQRLLRLV